MLPQTKKRKARNSTKVNLIFAALFHGIIVLGLVYFAAREGLLGRQIKKIAVEMVKEKPAEKPKEQEKPKVEPPKLDIPKLVQAPKIEEPKIAARTAATAGAAVAAPPVAAPPTVDVPSFEFAGGKAVESTSDPVQIYKNLIEYSLRSRWNRPTDIEDHEFVAEVEVSVDPTGQVGDPVWKKGSGNKRWDESVRQVLVEAKGVDRPPPAHFPSRFTVRFDVVQTEPVAP
jgi:hypothetical protein